MKRLIKSIFIIALLITNSGLSLSAEILSLDLSKDYLITTEKKVLSISVDNPAVLSLTPFFTIFNEKNVLLLHPYKTGRTSFKIISESGTTNFDTTIQATKEEAPTCLKKGDYEIMQLDAAPFPEDLKLDLPPSKIIEGGQ